MRDQLDPRGVVERWYTALASGDVGTVVATFHADLKASVVARFAQTWSIFAADGDRVVGMMSGDAMAKNGQPYDGVYCQLFTVREGQIAEYIEFVDTVLVKAAIFDNPLSTPSELQREPLTVPLGAAL